MVGMLTLIKGASIYAPEYIGEKDVLLAFDRIAYVGGPIDVSGVFFADRVEVIDAGGKLLVPGFIDQHVHIAGGGGEGGFSSRTREVDAADLLESGITTAIGVLGVDGITRRPESLYAKAKELENKGISTYIYTGSYQVPVMTITGSIERDLALIDKVVGVGEVALSDHRSFYPTVDELARIAAQARNGGMISGKAGVVHLHIGDNQEGLEPVFQVVRRTGIPARQFIPTHVNSNSIVLKHGLEFLNMGGFIDLTAGFEDEESAVGSMPAYRALKYFLESGADEDRITMSSDGHGSVPVFDSNGELIGIEAGNCKVLLEDVKKAVLDMNIPMEKVLKTVTSNPAKALRLDKFKGSIAEGKHADLILMDRELNIEAVFSMGKKLVEGGKSNI